jgi:phytoene dehydrogenase-like protein
VGGSLELSYDLEERLLRLGGTIRYGSRVVGLRAAAGRVNGVLLETGEIVDADFVISAGDLRHTVEWMRDAGIPARSQEVMLTLLRSGHAVAQVSLGVRSTCERGALGRRLTSDETESIVLYPGAQFGDLPAHRVVVRQYRRDHLLAPRDCRVITCQVETDYAAWAAIASDRRAYREQKLALASRVITMLERHWPGIGSCVEVIDVATPLTTERYTSNHLGSVHGTRPDRLGFAWPASHRGPRGSRLYFAGHWLTPGGGLHRAAQSGRYAVQQICAAAGRPFHATAARSTDAREKQVSAEPVLAAI